jgi:hypothetical protein
VTALFGLLVQKKRYLEKSQGENRMRREEKRKERRRGKLRREERCRIGSDIEHQTV